MLTRWIMTAAGLLALLGPALAQTQEQPPSGQDPAAPPESVQSRPSPEASGGTEAGSAGAVEFLPSENPTQLRTQELVGLNVTNAEGDVLGSVEDVLLDANGKVVGLVLSSGGVLGIGGKTVAISWTDVGSAVNAEQLTLNLTTEQLADAPEFKTRDDMQSGGNSQSGSY